MLYKILRLLPVLVLFCATAVFSQTATIVGASSFCLADSCQTYTVELSNGGSPSGNPIWKIYSSSSSLPIWVLLGTTIDWCPNAPGTYLVEVVGVINPNQSFQDTLQVTVSYGANPTIISTSAACPDSGSVCEKVCEFTTATYEALLPGGASTPVDWQVQGAENFTANGNQLLVEWGAAGQGQVTATVGSSGGGGAALQLFCGQSGIDPTVPPGGVLFGIAYVQTHDAVFPLTYTVTNLSTNFEVASGTTSSAFFNVNQLPPGTYVVKVLDAAGQTAQCVFSIVVNDSDCWVSPAPTELAHASDCNACDGFIGLTTFGGGVTGQYSYAWSDGFTGQNHPNLCPGTYSVTVGDVFGCTATQTIQISCPSTSCSGTSTLCVDILAKPEAIIASTPAANANDIIVVCQGQTVYFENQSTDATSYAWDFGDFNTSAQFEPSHEYPTPGLYNVMLIARNECFCSDTAFVEVYVLPANVPEIQCLGTVCEGESVTYTTSASCGSYTWVVSANGSILDGGGAADNFVTVQWNVPIGIGSEGTISLEVSGCAGVVCNEPNVIPIAILSDNVQIKGKDKVCQDATEEYFIPDFDGTEINWTVLGSGTIEDGQGSNRITVHWFGDANVGNPQHVIVEFNNCYLECSGRDTLPVFIVPQFYATGPIEICQNASGTYQSRNAINDNLISSNWQVFNQLGSLVWSSPGAANTANIPFSFPPGSYTVRATPASASSFCNDEYDIFVKIAAPPAQPTSILGEDEICPGIPYSYEASGQAGNDFTWTIRNGFVTSTMNGNPVNFTWGAAPPYSVSAAQIATTGLGCTGDTTTLLVLPIPDFSISGSGSVCREATETYSVPAFQNVDFQWTISPADAGTVVAGGGSESVDVLWHRPGAAVLSVKVCGTTKTFNVTVNDLPEPFVADQEVCFGTTASVTTAPVFANYDWRNEGGTTISISSNPNLGGGFYELEVTDANGCVGDTTFEIMELAQPNISISTPSYFALCSGGPAATIHAVVSGEGYDYAWTRNGVPVGSNSSTYSTTQPGDYLVVITDVDGCTATSNLLNLVDCNAIGGTCVGGLCLGGGGGPPLPGGGCVPAGNVDFLPVQSFTDCARFNFTNTSTNGVSGTFNWIFDNGNVSNWDNPPTQTYPGAGYYSVLLTGNVQASSPPGGACADGVLHDILVPVEAGFDHSTACPGAPVSFEDKSVFIPPAGIIAWSWDFGDPASGAANSSNLTNPSHTFAAPGNYTVELTITSSGGCQTSFSKMVTVHQPPSIQFLPPNLTCENAPLPFSAQLFSDVTSVSWNFGEPASGAANTSELFDSWHEFENPGSYLVTLTASNVYGCAATYSSNVSVTPNTLSGTISMNPGSPICEGASSTLTAPGGTSWEWSTGEATASITASTSNVYSVTLTNPQGCIYVPPPAILEVVAEPNGIIKAVEYNEFGQPVAFFENSHSVCEGEDVFLVIQGSVNNSYVWSNGETGDEVSFEEIKNNLLATGSHNFSVTVTDGVTGCTSVEGPFTVNVNPVPTVQIASAPSGFLCENQPATLNVVAPQPGLTYSWNTGETGTSISVVAGGTYFARAVNTFGCKGKSNEIELHNAPDIGKIPTGCHTRCQPDTMCLPDIQDVASYQWFFNGSPMPAPNGTLANPIFSQSGEYFVQLTDVFGCTSTSEVLSLDLQPGIGDVGGEVYFDVNKNGVIDAGDTLVSNIQIFIGNGTVNLDTVSSGLLGNYLFASILAQNYTLKIDTLNLPPLWSAVLASTTVQLTGCGDTEQFDWLLQINCPTQTAMVDLSACEGDSVFFEGIFIQAGASHTFTYTDQLGCDSVIIATVLSLPTQTMMLDLSACPGGSATFNGVPIATGASQTFNFSNQFGCDSNVVVTVLALPEDTTQVELGACSGETVDFNGQQLSVGEQGNWLGVNQFGCDSLVQATVVEFPHSITFVDGLACPGEFLMWEGQQIFAGQSVTFTEINAFGCMDTTYVSVGALPSELSFLELFACSGEPVIYAGQQLLPGFEGSFVVGSNMWGCDVEVYVTVEASPPVDFSLTAPQICPDSTNGEITVGNISGSTAPYSFSMDGQNFQPSPVFENLPPGSYEVLLQDANGCQFEQSAVLPTYAPLFVTAPEEVLFCSDSVQLSPQVVSTQLPATLTWQDGSTSPIFWATTPGEYIFTASNQCQEIEGSISVDYDLSVPPPQVFIPNIFSPNADGFNDCFRGYAASDVKLLGYQLKIFDRWGNFLFETSELEGCWDGKFRGKLLDPAVVVWFLFYQYENCAGEVVEVFKEGGVQVLR